jgi:hypothetical protein
VRLRKRVAVPRIFSIRGTATVHVAGNGGAASIGRCSGAARQRLIS